MWSTLDMLQHSQSLSMHFTILGGPLRRFWGAQPNGSVMSRLGLYIKPERPRLCLYVDTWLPRLLLYDWFWPPRSELIIAVLLYIRQQQMDRAQVQAWVGIPVPQKKETKEVIFIESAHWADSIIESRCPCVCLYVPFHAVFFEASHWSQHLGSKLGASTEQYLCWSTPFWPLVHS